MRVIVGLALGGGTVDEFTALYRNESVKWGRVVKLSGAKVD